MKALACALVIGTLACSPAKSETPPQTPESPPPSEPATAAAAPAERASEAKAEPAKTDATTTAAPAAGKHECNLVLGIAVTSEWFKAGFESVAGDRYWEAIFSPHTFVQDWANPAHAAWSQPIVSPCMHESQNPDRIVFVAANFDFKSREEWVKALTDVVETLKKKYPSLQQIDLMTMIRGPKGASCGDPKSVVPPFIDEAVQQMAATYPGLVKPAPRFEMDSCSAFKKGGPHFTDEGAEAAGKMVGEYYAGEGSR